MLNNSQYFLRNIVSLFNIFFYCYIKYLSNVHLKIFHIFKMKKIKKWKTSFGALFKFCYPCGPCLNLSLDIHMYNETCENRHCLQQNPVLNWKFPSSHIKEYHIRIKKKTCLKRNFFPDPCGFVMAGFTRFKYMYVYIYGQKNNHML